MSSTRRQMPKHAEFDNPPLIELVCGVAFHTEPRMRAAHVGLFWQRIRNEFPQIDETTPLPPLQQAGEDQFYLLDTSGIPTLPRTWMLSEDGSHLIQVQSDRFFYNWKREHQEAKYPRFEKIFFHFEKYLTLFIDTLREEVSSNVEIDSYELQYINHIGSWNGLNQIASTKALVDHEMVENTTRFLPPPSGLKWMTQYPLPEEKGLLSITANTAILRSTNEPILRLDLLARGRPPHDINKGFTDWFKTAHEWIVQGFCDATNEDLHKVWGRTK